MKLLKATIVKHTKCLRRAKVTRTCEIHARILDRVNRWAERSMWILNRLQWIDFDENSTIVSAVADNKHAAASKRARPNQPTNKMPVRMKFWQTLIFHLIEAKADILLDISNCASISDERQWLNENPKCIIYFGWMFFVFPKQLVFTTTASVWSGVSK